MNINESIMEVATLPWFWELGYIIGHGVHMVSAELRVKAGEQYVTEVTL